VKQRLPRKGTRKGLPCSVPLPLALTQSPHSPQGRRRCSFDEIVGMALRRHVLSHQSLACALIVRAGNVQNFLTWLLLCKLLGASDPGPHFVWVVPLPWQRHRHRCIAARFPPSLSSGSAAPRLAAFLTGREGHSFVGALEVTVSRKTIIVEGIVLASESTDIWTVVDKRREDAVPS
jgi:hypothetical protein